MTEEANIINDAAVDKSNGSSRRLLTSPQGELKTMSKHLAHSPLCGRQTELGILEGAFSRSFSLSDDDALRATNQQPITANAIKQELVLIQGHAGTGKSALAFALRAKVQHQRGLFLAGKFELGKNLEPYAVFVSLCLQLANDIVNDTDKNRLGLIRNAVKTSVGGDRKALTRIIPNLDTLACPPGDDVDDDALNIASCELPAADALRQFQSVFCRFLHAVSTIVPLVLFVDDLQWADKASLELLQAVLLHQLSPSSLLIIGAYRHGGIFDDDHEGFSRHISTASLLKKPPLYFFLRDVMHHSTSYSSSINLTKIQLCNFDEDSTNQLVAQTLDLSTDAASLLSQVVYDDSKGNPFHAVQNLLSLSEQGLIFRDSDTGEWTWDKNLVGKGVHTESPDERVFRKMDHMPDSVQDTLQVAALMGDEVDETSLAAVMAVTPVNITNTLELAAKEGVVVHVSSRGCYRFVHDNIRQAVLSTIDDKTALSFKVGYTLWKRLPPLYFEAKIFTILNLMMAGIHTVTARDERYALAALYFEAGLKASSHFDFPDALLYSDTGIECLHEGDFWSEKYELTLDLYNAAADCAVCNQNHDRVSELVAEVYEHARSLKDKLPAYLAQINSMGQYGRVQEATRVGMDVLKQLGEPLPCHVTKRTLIAEMIKTKIAFWKLPSNSILTLPPMQQEDKIAAMNVMSILLPYAYQVASDHVVLLGTRLSRLSIYHGLHKACASGFLTYGWIMCRADRQEGYRIGKLALSVAQHTLAREQIPRLELQFHTFVHHWKCPLRESLGPLANAEQFGLEIGDFESAMFALRFQCVHSLFCGNPLSGVEQMTVGATRQMSLFKQEHLQRLTMPVIQYIHNLQGETSDALELFKGGQEGDTDSIQLTCLNLGLQLAFLWGDHDLVEEVSARRMKLKLEGFALYSFTLSRLVEALTAIERIRNGIQKKHNTKIVVKVRKQLKCWARDSPSNFLHKLQLLDAEWKSVAPRKAGKKIVKALYEKAIQGALKEQFINEAAIACELYAGCMNRWGNQEQARKYWNQAHDLYLRWGANEKARRMLISHSLDGDIDDF